MFSSQFSVEHERVLAFLVKLGLSVTRVAHTSGFMPGVRIVDGGLWVAPDVAVPDLLHEAGHLAVVPSAYRGGFSDDIDEGTRRMFEALKDEAPDSPLLRAALQAGEAEATAWAWAAGIHLGLPEPLILADKDYEGTGAEVRQALSMGQYLGIHGLRHAGFCSHGLMAKRQGLSVYPVLRFWLQDGTCEPS